MIYIFFLVVIGYSQSFIERMIAQQIAGYLKSINITVSEQQVLQDYMKASEIAIRYNISITEVVGEGLAIYSSMNQTEKEQLLKDVELLRDIGLDRIRILVEYLMKNVTATQDQSKVLPLIHEIAQNEAINPDNDYGLADSEFFEELLTAFSEQIDQLVAWAMEHPDEVTELASKLNSYLEPADDPVQPPAHNTTNNTQPVTPPQNQNQTVNNTVNNTNTTEPIKTNDTKVNTTEPIKTNDTQINTTNQESNQTVQNNTDTNKTAELDDDDEFEEEELDEDEDETIVAKSNSNDSSALLVIMVLLLSLLVLIAALLIRRHINRQKLLTFKMNDELTEQGVQAF